MKVILYNFSTISNETEAYIVGYIMADGYVLTSPSWRLGLQLAAVDLYMLKRVRDYICPDSPVLTERFNSYKIQICRREIIENLVNLGIEPNKTGRELKIPLMDESLTRHFIRGYFDGDGSLVKDRKYLYWYICSPTESILKDFQVVLKSNNIGSKIHVQKRIGTLARTPQGDTAECSFDQYRLNIQNRTDIERVYEFLYSGSTISLNRKREILENWLLTNKAHRVTKSLLDRNI